MPPLAAAGPTAYWYLTRGTGTIALILLTLSVAVGVANAQRLQRPGMPRFVLDAVHRNVSLLAMVFLVVHILTSVLDSFAPISLLDAVVPFAGTYRPLWLGLGTLGFDLMLAVTVTSLVRYRLGYRSWRIIHWVAYASWPVSLLHGLGTGSDTKAAWMLAVVVACVILTLAAVVTRATSGWPDHLLPRLGALGASALVPLGLLVWLPSGPLAHGWARRAGTPASLLGSAAGSSASSSRHGPPSPGGSAAARPAPFTATASGTITQGEVAGGQLGIDILLKLTGEQLNTLGIQLRGQPLGNGELQMTSSQVTLSNPSGSLTYRGRVTQLEGTNIAAIVSDSGGQTVQIVARLQIDQAAGSASGTVSVS